MLYLNSDEILSAVSLQEVMSAVEESYRIYEKSEYEMPARVHIDHGDKETLLYMPCFTKQVFGTKMLSSFTDNPKRDKPVLDGLMILNDVESGQPICIMDAKALTMIRTGAVGGLGVRYTTPKSIKNLGLIGTGIQGFYQVLCACIARNIEKVYVFDIYKDKAYDFAKRLQDRLPKIDIAVVDTVEYMLNNAEAVITATTSIKPVIPSAPELIKNKHFIGIGSYKPHVREYPDEFFNVVDRVYVDVEFAKEETGDLCIPIEKGLIKTENICTFGQLIVNNIPIEESSKGTTFFKSVGMAVFDVVVANLIYKKALELKMGTILKIT